MTTFRKKVVEIAETAKALEISGAGKDGKKSKGVEYPENLAQVLYI